MIIFFLSPLPQFKVCVLEVYSCVAKMLNIAQTSSGGFFQILTFLVTLILICSSV